MQINKYEMPFSLIRLTNMKVLEYTFTCEQKLIILIYAINRLEIRIPIF